METNETVDLTRALKQSDVLQRNSIKNEHIVCARNYAEARMKYLPCELPGSKFNGEQKEREGFSNTKVAEFFLSYFFFFFLFVFWQQ